ncbi:hypothetical protein BMT54_08880 [Pasteurellaceae bacterium 15-036681]|nr:hypothetical protein BMT54_08880 [Pasteurellaceae bacterium 15-036681]
MPTIRQLTAELYQKLHPLVGDVRVKTYFSYVGIFKNEVMFGLYKEKKFYLYIAEPILPILEHYPEVYLLEDSQSGIHSRRYHYIPDNLLDSESIAHQWIIQAIEELTQIKQKLHSKPRAIRTLPNMNHRIEKLLRKLGINTVEELNQKGEIAIYIEMIKNGISIDNSMLFKLYGAINHQHLCIMSEKEKHNLVCEAELALYKAGLPKRFNQV